ncbi:disease resistance RPP13-like protein 4-like protein [Corchorus capsularis]|uniref:Disease resistance RPP13-like protein 4-like protein n=1 Tax=Corchorus capsularis TaxID=210143 RepID=A0A1R3GNB6_COCAP|nr:disease resistance RPP13-like protein 4-like protein [Corchorus capsularis]
MSSPNVDNDSDPPLVKDIQNITEKIIEEITKWRDSVQVEDDGNAHSPQQTTASAANNSSAATNQDGGAKQEEDHVTGQQHDKKEVDDVNAVSDQKKKQVPSDKKETKKESNKKLIKRELNTLCNELVSMLSSEKVKTFSDNLSLPPLVENLNNIFKDLPRVTDTELPKQVPINIRMLRNNIARVQIQILLQHQAANANSDANRRWKKTVATSEADDLPRLYNEPLFESSYYFKEIKEKYNQLDIRHKICLLCFAVFPESAEIKKRLLRFWWVGENLVPPEEGKDEMKIVSDILDTFVKKGFIQPIRKKNKLQPRSYKMTPIVRSCLIKFAKEAHFFDYDKEGKPTMDFTSCKKASMVKREGAQAQWFSDYLDGQDNKQDTEKLSADMIKLQMLFNFPDRQKLNDAPSKFNELQTLFNVSKQFPELPKEWLLKMENIKVLFLGRWESEAGVKRHIEVEDIDFLRGLKTMKKLRLLSLQGISGIARLPGAICELSGLKILDLRACHNLEKLPDKIGLLKMLTYLDLSECYLLHYIPKQLNKLSELEVLKGFVIGNAKNSCTLEDLSVLKKLRKLSVNVSNPKFNIDDEKAALSKFESLQKLRIAWGSGAFSENNLPGGGRNQSEQDNLNGGDSGEANSKATKQGTGSQQQLGTATKVVMFANKMKSKRKGLQKLVKLDIQCFPNTEPPTWLVPRELKGLTNLSIRGGNLSHLKQDPDDPSKWNVNVLRLKFLVNFKMNWKDMTQEFPELNYLENVRCPRITFCPCDASGVWQKPSESN